MIWDSPHKPRSFPPSVSLSHRFDEALRYATIIHAGQVRKKTQIPYIAHILGVVSIALEHGADENEAIGALLHDAGEDAGGVGRIQDIRIRFGEKVAEIVEGCTDAVTIPKPPWLERKEKYIAHLATASPSIILVSAADKLHNTRSIARDLRRLGDDLWMRFNGGKEGSLSYYRALVTAFLQHGKSELTDELDRVVSEIEGLAKQRQPPAEPPGSKSFIWPQTAVLPSSKALSGDQFWYQEGLLSFMGYRVGANGVRRNVRYGILDYVYNERIPLVNSILYMKEWGEPASAVRLSKMANSLAAFARLARRDHRADKESAISDWEADLEYLKSKYYDGRYDFTWPSTPDRLVRY